MSSTSKVSNDKKEELNHLLDYMLHHNRHHNEELAELADSIKDTYPDISKLIQDACSQFESGCRLLEQARNELEEK